MTELIIFLDTLKCLFYKKKFKYILQFLLVFLCMKEEIQKKKQILLFSFLWGYHSNNIKETISETLFNAWSFLPLSDLSVAMQWIIVTNNNRSSISCSKLNYFCFRFYVSQAENVYFISLSVMMALSRFSLFNIIKDRFYNSIFTLLGNKI